MMSSLHHASLNLSYGFDYKLLPFTISGAIHHLAGPVRSLPIRSLCCLVTVKQHSSSPFSHFSSTAIGTAKRKTAHFFHYH